VRRWIIALLVAAGPAAGLAQPAPADPGKGQALWAQCAACHEIDTDANTLGPSLKGVMGRKAGGLDGYNYSGPMKRADITWTAQTLDAFLADPQATVPGTKMPFAGMPDPGERAALVAYIQSKAAPAAAPPPP